MQIIHHFFEKLKSKISNLDKISKWGFQWKTLFNPDRSNQGIDIFFSNECDKENHSPLVFNDTKLQYIDHKLNKCDKIIGIMKKKS